MGLTVGLILFSLACAIIGFLLWRRRQANKEFTEDIFKPDNMGSNGKRGGSQLGLIINSEKRSSLTPTHSRSNSGGGPPQSPHGSNGSGSIYSDGDHRPPQTKFDMNNLDPQAQHHEAVRYMMAAGLYDYDESRAEELVHRSPISLHSKEKDSGLIGVDPFKFKGQIGALQSTDMERADSTRSVSQFLGARVVNGD